MTERTLVYELDMPIRWGDMDAMGHVNNTVYFRYIEQCRIDWFTSMGIDAGPAGVGPVVVNASCEFLRQLEYPGTVRIRQFAGEIGRSSFQTHIEMTRVDDLQTVYATGAARVVWVDFPRKKSVPLPAEIREAITRPWSGLI